MQFEKVTRPGECARHHIPFAHGDLARARVDHGDDSHVDRSHRRRVVVQQAGDPVGPSLRHHELLVELAGQRIAHDVVAVFGIDVAAHADGPQAEEASLAAPVRPAETEDAAGAHDHGVGNDLLESGILFDRVALGEEALGVHGLEPGARSRHEAARGVFREEILTRYDIDAFLIPDHRPPSTKDPMRDCASASSARPRSSRQRANSR